MNILLAVAVSWPMQITLICSVNFQENSLRKKIIQIIVILRGYHVLFN